MERIEIIDQLLVDAGRAPALAKKFKLSTTTVYKWGLFGMPRTEYTGETSYAKEMIALAHVLSDNKYRLDQILPAKRNYRKKIKLKQKPVSS